MPAAEEYVDETLGPGNARDTQNWEKTFSLLDGLEGAEDGRPVTKIRPSRHPRIQWAEENGLIEQLEDTTLLYKGSHETPCPTYRLTTEGEVFLEAAREYE